MNKTFRHLKWRLNNKINEELHSHRIFLSKISKHHLSTKSLLFKTFIKVSSEFAKEEIIILNNILFSHLCSSSLRFSSDFCFDLDVKWIQARITIVVIFMEYLSMTIIISLILLIRTMIGLSNEMLREKLTKLWQEKLDADIN